MNSFTIDWWVLLLAASSTPATNRQHNHHPVRATAFTRVAATEGGGLGTKKVGCLFSLLSARSSLIIALYSSTVCE